MVETPVLYITFARPEYASQSFAAIKKAQPKKLYFYSNKARDEKPDEVARNLEVRSYISQIDWDCEVMTWFRNEYVDIYTSLWGAIDWVFENEEKAIIIEEDVVASLTFYNYIDKLIDKLEDNSTVWMISGNNCTPEFNPKDCDYWGTKFIHIFGWATWASRWKSLDRTMKQWPVLRESSQYKIYWNNWLMATIQKIYYNKVYNHMDKYNPWDFIFSYNMVKNNAYCIVPTFNLVADVGIAGVHHNQQVKSVYQILEDMPMNYDVSRIPSTIECEMYDARHFYHYILCGLIRRKIRKYLHI